MKGLRIAATTLGCKVNQVETASLLERFEEKGLRPVSFKEEADVYLINTCAVTARAAYESRQLIRRALKRKPLLVAATGCYVQIGAREIVERIEEPVLLVGQDRKIEIPDLVEELEVPLKEPRLLVGDVSTLRRCVPFRLRRFPGHHRAFLRVQDGCNAFCSYCVVPYARGPARSLPEEEVIAQARRFRDEGYREIVVTGVHLGLWGVDLSPPRGLADLLQALLENVRGPRWRLSSLHPSEIDRPLLDLMAENEAVCPHFHLSLQSGDDEVLAAMGRPYRAALIEEVVREIKDRLPEAAIGADVIAGFPTESEEAFERTAELLRRLPIAYLHVFPFSPRPGTRAAELPQIPPDRVAKRARVLQEISRAKKKAFYSQQIGRSLKVLVERYDAQRGLYRGLSENYVVVHFAGPPGLEGSVVSVKVERLVNELLYGRMAPSQEGPSLAKQDLGVARDVA